jgi:predicted signal transduction protein with EAL and GGDEF domain/CheY-like chemotaxis protein
VKSRRRKNEPPVLSGRVTSHVHGAKTTLPHLDDSVGRLRVLVADDEPVVRDLYRQFLLASSPPGASDEPPGPELDVVLCSQAEEAVAEFTRAVEADESFAVAFLDVRMPPGKTGVWAAERIRKLDPAVEIVIVTAHSDINPLEIASRVPPVEKLLYLQKPVHPHEMSQCVAALGAKWRAHQELRRSLARLATAQRIARFAHWEWNPRTGEAAWSSELNRIFGLPAGLPGGPVEILWQRIHPQDEGQVASGVHHALEEGEPYSFGYRVVLPDDQEKAVQHAVVAVSDQSGKALRMVGAVQDVTEARENERKILRLAYYDHVTQIPNRIFLTQHLSFVLRHAKRYDRQLALMYVDLDSFKRVNDTFGHSFGDGVLSGVAGRLRDCIRDSDCIIRPEPTPNTQGGDTVARFGGDEFIVLLTEVQRPQDSARVARRILAALSEPITVAGEELVVHASIGIAVFPNDGTDPDSLLKNADAAMYHAKAQGRNNFQFYTESLNARAAQRLALETSLRRALGGDELSLHYQPKVDLRERTVVGAEALLRWEHPDLGLVAPDEFLPAAEESGLIVPLGEWVLREVCRQLKDWEQQGFAALRIAVNLSFRQFKDRRLIARLRDTLAAAGVTPGRLEIELSEDVLMEEAEESERILAELQRMGVRIAMDDFGTGYSSLKLLKRLPIASVKIDRSLIDEVVSSEDDEAIVAAIIALAHRMKLQVVAEGVETPEQMDLLRRYGCDLAQGYLISAPLPAAEFARLFHPGRQLDRRVTPPG